MLFRSVGTLVRLPGDWRLAADANYSVSAQKVSYGLMNLVNNSTFGGYAPLLWSGVINPFVDTIANPVAVERYYGEWTGYNKDTMLNYNVRASGPLFPLPGGRPVLTVGSDGSQRAGADLRELVEKARQAKAFVTPLARRVGSRDAVEQAAILGALDPNLLANQEQAKAAAEYIAKRLNALSHENERGWVGTASPSSMVFERRLRGETDRAVIDGVVMGVPR